MSLRLMAQAMSIKVGNPLRKLVLIKLADNANDDGVCFPSYQYIADVCEISKASARTHIDALIQMGLVSKKARKNKDGSSSNLYQLHLDKGVPADSTGMPADSIGGMPAASTITSHSSEPVNEPSSSQPAAPTRKRTLKFSGDDLKTANWIFGLLQKLNPNITPPNFERWANEVRLMREVDKRSHREICELFQWANRDPFWQANILSPAKLREKWDQLAMKKLAANGNGGRTPVTGTGDWNTAAAWAEVI